MPSSGRTIAIVLAILLAGVATFAIYRYVDGLRDQAFQDAELVEVFVAQGLIPAGSSAQNAIDQGFIERSQVPRESRPEGAITALDQIQGLVAADRILPGEILQRARFGDPGSIATGFEIPQDRQAISFQVGIPPGVAGFIRPRDRINVIAHIVIPEGGEQVIGPDGTLQPADDAQAATVRAQFLMQGIEVLAVGRRVIVTDPQGEAQDQIQQTEAVLLTVAVTAEQAEQLVFAQQEGLLYLTLLPTLDEDEEFQPEDTPGRTFENLFL